ncbi:hypothetical protein [Roseomonas sp. CECT 9278]|uniref:hypothetical protein n=1 Tax=Roseomonas sp. CECT 9278 TaxID=2845823 RepID=UPI001E63E8AA|nr:hypothetical protein [Roseomonas sp. CECT 9278]
MPNLVGTWTGVWDNNPRFATSLIIERVTESGVIEGRYVFQRSQPVPFSSRRDGRSFRFEMSTYAVQAPDVFTFTLQPDGRLSGSRQWLRGVNQTVLTRA